MFNFTIIVIDKKEVTPCIKIGLQIEACQSLVNQGVTLHVNWLFRIIIQEHFKYVQYKQLSKIYM